MIFCRKGCHLCSQKKYIDVFIGLLVEKKATCLASKLHQKKNYSRLPTKFSTENQLILRAKINRITNTLNPRYNFKVINFKSPLSPWLAQLSNVRVNVINNSIDVVSYLLNMCLITHEKLL